MTTKRITQATFDDVVRENVEEFEMSPEEALGDAIQQFESQGVDLVNIIKAIPEVRSGSYVSSKHSVLEALDQLKKTVGDSTDEQTLKVFCTRFTLECDVDISHRITAGSNGAYPTLIILIERNRKNLGVLPTLLESVAALLNGQPDLIDSDGIQLMCNIVTENMTYENIVSECFKIIRLVCTMHELNRRAFVKAEVIPLLIQTLKKHSRSTVFVREVCSLVRILTVDDDIRVPFGKAHDNAKMIVEAGALKVVLSLLEAHVNNAPLVRDLCMTLSRLAVCNKICQEIVDLGGLTMAFLALSTNVNDQSVVKQVLLMLKAAAGNDEVKVAIMSAGGAARIVQAVSQHIKQPGVCEAGFAAMAAIMLRNPNHCHMAMEAGIAPVIIQAMELHPNEPATQKQACRALRNLVARSMEHRPTILALGAEPLIHKARACCEDEAKAALRDLRCEVEFTELWKGEKNPLVK